jgi:hypothetical protein
VPEPSLAPALDPRMRALLPEDGPTFDEVKRQQRPENSIPQRLHELREVVDGYIEHKVEHKAVDIAAHVLEHSFNAAGLASKIELVGSALLTLKASYEITEAAYYLAVTRPMEEGKQQAEGRMRDQKNLTLLMMVQLAQPNLLPDGYYLKESSRILHVDGKANLNKNPSFRIATTVVGKAVTDADLGRARDILVAATRDGVATAYQMGIDSDAALEKLKKEDANFRTRYESDPAFRIGIQSVVWQATYHRDEYETAAALNGGYRGTPARM